MVGLLDSKATITGDLVDRKPFGGKSSKKRPWDVIQGREEDVKDYSALLLADYFPRFSR